MTWAEKTVVRILLIVARIMTRDVELRKELQNLATHISVHAPEE